LSYLIKSPGLSIESCSHPQHLTLLEKQSQQCIERQHCEQSSAYQACLNIGMLYRSIQQRTKQADSYKD